MREGFARDFVIWGFVTLVAVATSLSQVERLLGGDEFLTLFTIAGGVSAISIWVIKKLT